MLVGVVVEDRRHGGVLPDTGCVVAVRPGTRCEHGPEGGYGSALRQTLRDTAAAYGYTLTIATTSALLVSLEGSPGVGDLFLFGAGGLAAFAALDVFALALPARDEPMEATYAFAGALNRVSMGAGLGAATGMARAVDGSLAWLLAAMAATGVYLAVVALQLTIAAALRR